MALTATETRALQALRAPGGMTTGQARERWPGIGAQPLHALVRAGLARHDGGRFTITEAGRAACPLNNQILAARAAGKSKEETTMPRSKITRSDVFDAICAAGTDGTTVKALSDRLSVSDQTIFKHLKHLTNEPGAVVRKPRRGVLVATKFLDGIEESAPAAAAPGVDEAEVAKIAREYDEMIDFDLEAAQGVDVTADGPERQVRLVVADVHIAHPDGVEFCLYSSGRMELLTEDGPTVELSAAVLRKLRDFLGLFAECE